MAKKPPSPLHSPVQQKSTLFSLVAMLPLSVSTVESTHLMVVEWYGSGRVTLNAIPPKGDSMENPDFKLLPFYWHTTTEYWINPKNKYGFTISAVVTAINIADIVGSLTMKGLALPRLIDKDSYDIYAITGFYGGNPAKAAKSYVNSVRKAKLTTKEKSIIQFSMSRINQAFRSMDSYGVFAVSRFVGTNINSDVYLRVSTFLKNVNSAVR